MRKHLTTYIHTDGHTHAYIHAGISNTPTCIHARMHMCKHTGPHPHTDIHKHAHIHAGIHMD